MSTVKNLIGKKFERLLVLKRASNGPSGQSRWLCICDCGRNRIVYGISLNSGNTKSCGCFQRQAAHTSSFKHGFWGTPEYGVWKNMVQRCENEKDPNFDSYGGRGIKVCARWKGSFKEFLVDMGCRPKRKDGNGSVLTIERVNNNKGYSPSNCKWATYKEQANNRRPRQRIAENGV